MRYIHLNPVRAGMVTRPEDYEYSSHRAYLGMEPAGVIDVDPVLRHFGARKEVARDSYRKFVEAESSRAIVENSTPPTRDEFLEVRNLLTRRFTESVKLVDQIEVLTKKRSRSARSNLIDWLRQWKKYVAYREKTFAVQAKAGPRSWQRKC
ncbi:MAG TPA: hypothetical protein VGW76_05830 [Pyrinomonadaceae bacterium]|nr:hypothetical protein [Pyrinomonadaceae bacterium]